MKREIRDKRNKLRQTSIRLKELAFLEDLGSETNFKLRQKQDDQYKRFRFYDNLIKASEKVKKK